MRIDYIEVQDSGTDESTFVEAHWTEVWEKEGGPRGQLDKVARQDEYGVMRGYLDEFPNGRLLDAGCGLGDWVLFLESEGFEVTGLDISRKTVEQLRKRFPDKDFQAGDIRDTRMADNAYDVCFSWGVFEHFENGPGDCLREAFRILKPGGLLFASVPFDNWRMSTKSTFAKPSDATLKQRFYQYRFTRAEWAREMSQAGFEVEALKPIHKRQGVLRCLHHEFFLPYEWLLTRGLSAVMAPFIPGAWIAHMLLGVARKPDVCEK